MAAADRMWRAIEERYAPSRVQREVPVHAYVGGQLVSGRVDMLLDTPGGFVVVDHKSFPGGHDAADQKAIGSAAQLSLYARAIETVTGDRCRAIVVHLPIGGRLIELRATEGLVATVA